MAATSCCGFACGSGCGIDRASASDFVMWLACMYLDLKSLDPWRVGLGPVVSWKGQSTVGIEPAWYSMSCDFGHPNVPYAMRSGCQFSEAPYRREAQHRSAQTFKALIEPTPRWTRSPDLPEPSRAVPGLPAVCGCFGGKEHA